MRTKTWVPLLIFLHIAFFMNAQELNYSISNPVIIHQGGAPGSDYFQFDLELSSNQSNLAMFSGKIEFTFNPATLDPSPSSWLLDKLTLLEGINTLGNEKYGISPSSFYGNRVTIIWRGDNAALALHGMDQGAADWNYPQQNIVQVLRIRAKIINTQGTAGIAFSTGKSSYVAGHNRTGTYSSYFDNSRNFQDVYTGRIFSHQYGWSQSGTSTSVSPVQGPLDWSFPANTSVYDWANLPQNGITTLNAKASSLRIHERASLLISPTGSLTVTGPTEIRCWKGLVIDANATGYGQFIDNGTIQYLNNGTAVVGAYFKQAPAPNGKWHMWSPAVQSFWSFTSFLDRYLQYYNEPTHNWTEITIPNQQFTTPMKGFMVSSMPGTSSDTSVFENYLNTGTIVSPVLTRTLYTVEPDGDGYNLIGNPYPSGLNLTGIDWGTMVDKKAWFWDPDGGNYVTWLYAGGGTHGGPGMNSPHCPSQQAFWVHHSTGSTAGATITVTNANREITTEAFLKDQAKDLLGIKVTSGMNDFHDAAVIRFMEDAGTGDEDESDAEKFQGDERAPQLFSYAATGRKLTVNALPFTGLNQMVPIGFSCSVEGIYSLDFTSAENFDNSKILMLEDLQSNSFQDLKKNSVYSFIHKKEISEKRFLLHVYSPEFAGAGISDDVYRIYSSGSSLYISGDPASMPGATVRLFDMMGKQLYAGQLQSIPVNKIHLPLPEGIYLVQLTSVKAEQHVKIFLGGE
ncbi:MAG: T9SS type A sorting domain-containing protein [Syntrophothermus sp.]